MDDNVTRKFYNIKHLTQINVSLINDDIRYY